ncbi:MAG: ABC transporter permease subunit [Candidatus Delongbacteria bacterium]|nr:ABC transporter permease subunit [Candidatus Delongbacteria bacterium]
MSNIFIIAKKDFKLYFTSPAAYVVLVMFLILSGWLFTNYLFVEGGQADLRSIFEVVPFVFLFFIPAISMKQIAEERKNGTMELLVTLPIKDSEIILGKFLATFYMVNLALLLTLTNVVTVALLGKPDWGVLISGYIGLGFLGAIFTAIGIYTSSITNNQVVAFITSFFVIFVFLIVDSFLEFLPYPQIFEFLSTNFHYHNMVKGVLDSRGIVYFISLILIFLTGAVTALESRKK